MEHFIWDLEKWCTVRNRGSKIRFVKYCIGLTLVENETREENERLMVVAGSVHGKRRGNGRRKTQEWNSWC